VDLTNTLTIKNLCKEFCIRPSKKLGQNFLINENILKKIINASELKKHDVVLEIGPGFGALTQELLKYVNNLIVIEKDKRLTEFLGQEIKKLSNKEIKGQVEIINGDVLDWDSSAALRAAEEYKIVSNLPYQITAPVLWKFLHEKENKPELMVLMVQKEVAERIVAKPGMMIVLSVLCQFYADVELVDYVSRKNFWPEPDVDSAIVKLKTLMQLDSSHRLWQGLGQAKNFFKLVKKGFSAKRKMLKNNLPGAPLEKIGLNKKIRAQELSVEDWTKLFNCFNALMFLCYNSYIIMCISLYGIIRHK
jgi:16S rRNA (adenine1518-N6/adenine1519-N6)-dimethyltransferase